MQRFWFAHITVAVWLTMSSAIALGQQMMEDETESPEIGEIETLAPAIEAIPSPNWISIGDDPIDESIVNPDGPVNGGGPNGCNPNSCNANGCAAGGCTAPGCTGQPPCDPFACFAGHAVDPLPRHGRGVVTGFDSWRARIADGSSQNNNGVHTGINFGTPLPAVERFGVGWQLGGSYGAYDFMGRDSAQPTNQPQQQIFLTTGLFRRADVGKPFSGGVVHDWMLNNNFGVYAQSPTLGQWRGQVAYAVGARNEFGLWGTLRDIGGTRNVGNNPVQYHGINQLNLLWHRNYAFGGDSWVWVGAPGGHRIDGSGRVGEILLGGWFSAPLNDYVSLFSNLQYLKPSAAPGASGSTQDSFNISFGLAFYPKAAARNRTVAGRAWMPYMPVANNGSFLVDASRTR